MRQTSNSEDEFRILVNCVKEYAIFMIDPKGQVRTWNEGAKRIVGYDEKEVLGKPVSIFYTKEDIEKGMVDENLKKVREFGTFEYEGWRVRKDGTKFWAHVLFTACYDKAHHLTGYAAVTRDISLQKRNEHNLVQVAVDALRQSEFRYRQIVETAHEGIWLIDEMSRTIFVNKKMCEIFECSQDELLGRDINYFMNNAGKEVASRAKKMQKEGMVESFDFNFSKKSKKHIWTNISVNTILDDQGNYKGALAMVSDVTEKKILQQQLLEEQIEKQKEITKAVIDAQERERADIGEELHDNVNQLLAASKLYLNHGLSQPDQTSFIIKGQEYIVTAMEEIRKLSHILVGPKQDKTIGLIDSVEELINNLSILDDMKIEFCHDTYHEEKTDVGLKLVIYRIIQEQLNNILKHAAASEIEIELREDADTLTVNINDNGKGFNSSAKSNGIGLKNIRNRAAVYDGTVKIISSPGNGCKMKIKVMINAKTKALRH